MTFKPAHKDTDNPPGQVVNSISVPETPRSKTIGGIIDRVMREEAKPIKQKLSFDQWYKENRGVDFGGATVPQLRYLWVAAQENV